MQINVPLLNCANPCHSSSNHNTPIRTAAESYFALIVEIAEMIKLSTDDIKYKSSAECRILYQGVEKIWSKSKVVSIVVIGHAECRENLVWILSKQTNNNVQLFVNIHSTFIRQRQG